VNLYVANINYDINEAELEGVFMQYGEVESTKIIYDRVTQRSKGFGFIEMPNEVEARAAIEALDGFDLKGRPLKVAEAKPPKR